ncbi:MAG: hypothetical protein IIB45_06970 [Candidatus Marinimicrobia bacterium]|nr:hypothetical protein [Candidatus Neomarinimicrobiota bacterium]
MSYLLIRIKDVVCLVCLLSLATDVGFMQSLSKTTHTLNLGEEKVWVDIYERTGADITLLNLHDNENTSAETGRAFVERHGGRLIELRHGRGREVVVRLDGVLHRFDPNRMFSDVGLRKSLEYFHNNTDEIFVIAAAFRDRVIELFAVQEGMVVIALHNNTPDKLTIKDFRPGEWYGEDTREVSINPQQDTDNFFVVTQVELFNALSSSGYNVALRAKSPPDRGMLIDYCQRLGALCITVEAEHGHRVEQKEMLEALWKILTEKGIVTTYD